MPRSSPTSSPLGFDEQAIGPDDRLATALKRYENLLRQTLAAGGSLVTVAAEAQAERNLDPIAGHRIFHAFNAANLDVASALSHVARGHRQIDVFAQALGIDLTGYGKTHPMPEDPFVGAHAVGSVVDA